jgi:hypothetical protein
MQKRPSFGVVPIILTNSFPNRPFVKVDFLFTIVRTVFRGEAETLDFSLVTVLNKRAETLILLLPI